MEQKRDSDFPQNLLGVLFGFDLLANKDLLDDALLIYNKGGADGALGLLAIHHLLAPGTHYRWR